MSGKRGCSAVTRRLVKQPTARKSPKTTVNESSEGGSKEGGKKK